MKIKSIITLFLSIISLNAYAQESSIQKKLAALEASSGGRLGVYALNTENNSLIQYRADERFLMQSTFKVMGVSTMLKQYPIDNPIWKQKITYTKQDFGTWSPITEKHLADGMTVSELCAAAIMYSDDTAINLIVKKLGGPETLVTFAQSIGNNNFKLDSSATELHHIYTTTPAAMGKSLQQLALGNILTLPQRQQLITWMKDCATGNNRIRAGVPKGWVVADKTGSGDYGITNDIAIIWPPTKHAPIVVAIYFIQDKDNKDAARRPEVIAAATRILIKEFGQ